jgi:hypothetical protein
MASSASTFSEVGLQRARTKYRWPPLQLNFWLLIMLIGSSTILGVFASFLGVQSQLGVGVPWYVFPSYSFCFEFELLGWDEKEYSLRS